MTDIAEADRKTANTTSKRKKLFALLSAGVAVAALGWIIYDVLVSSHYAYTDNAYVGADVAQVTPLVGGPVKAVLAEDTRHVRQGDILVVLDDTDARLALANAEAQLSLSTRKVRSYFSNDAALGAAVTRAGAQIAAAKAELAKAKLDLDRRQALMASGAVSGEELTSAQNAYTVAQAALAQAQAAQGTAAGQRQANGVLIDDTTVQSNPEVAAARARLDQAKVDLARTVLRAPIDGVVSRRQVQVGQRVQPGQMLMVVVPIQDAYVDANFKEGQLENVRPGQPVTLQSDLYGSSVTFHGRVVGFSGGTGAAFSVVPTQNATGNWIKVVQRLPVRIALDPKELQDHPLQVGLSMAADIHLSH